MCFCAYHTESASHRLVQVVRDACRNSFASIQLRLLRVTSAILLDIALITHNAFAALTANGYSSTTHYTADCTVWLLCCMCSLVCCFFCSLLHQRERFTLLLSVDENMCDTNIPALPQNSLCAPNVGHCYFVKLYAQSTDSGGQQVPQSMC
jgi:hypothetical protein